MVNKSFKVTEWTEVQDSSVKKVPSCVEATVKNNGAAYRVAVPREWVGKLVTIKLVK